MASRFVVEHLSHLGIVAEVCREIGVAEWLDQQDPTQRPQVSLGTATVALVLNGLGFSNRRLYLVPQFFADKPVEHLLGAGILAEALNDDCLGRTLGWLYAHDVTRLFAGLALRARRAFGVEVGRLHADTTSFSVHGQYDPYAQNLPEALETPRMLKAAAQEQADEGEEGASSVIEVTYGYSREHREDLKQWMLALVTSGEGIPQFLQPLDGNASDKRVLLQAVQALTQQLRAAGEWGEPRRLRRQQRTLQRAEHDPAQRGRRALDQPRARDLHRRAGHGAGATRDERDVGQLAAQPRRHAPLVESRAAGSASGP
jgi:Domain of unknown function (DUF4277)